MGFDRDFESVLDVRYGRDTSLDALLLHFMTENHLEYTIDPDKNGSMEQLKFMLALKEGDFYAPCSDDMFLMLLQEGLHEKLQCDYIAQWKTFIKLTRNFCSERKQASRFMQLARHKLRMVLASPIVMPSRLMKRLITIFMTQSGIDDPYRDIRKALNRRAARIVASDAFDRVVNNCIENMERCERMDELRFRLDMLQIERLVRISTLTDNWSPENFNESALERADIDGEIQASDHEFQPMWDCLCDEGGAPKRILYLPNRSGGLLFDLEVVKNLLRLGHRVVMALKEGFYFEAPAFWDREREPVLMEAFRDAHFVSEDRLSKNELLEIMGKHPFVIISDGTREKFNPYRCSVTFARAWKECDVVFCKGESVHNRVIRTSHQFTRDIINFYRDDQGDFHLHYRPKADWAHKFDERHITGMANRIIGEMREARDAGKSVMFYSGIIGSVPGQTQMAIKLITAFVDHLRNQLDDVYIINPGEHFEEGMDADDLMFMWEQVQRSGYINVWRFQTHFDIEKSFELIGVKVPPVWTGKDSTYSTGCTKEMHIALDVQRSHPELQIIGPNPEKFFRRAEYGVGKFCDVAIDSCG